MAAAARLLTSLFQSSRGSFPALAAEKPAQEVSRSRFVLALLKALSGLNV